MVVMGRDYLQINCQGNAVAVGNNNDREPGTIKDFTLPPFVVTQNPQ